MDCRDMSVSMSLAEHLAQSHGEAWEVMRSCTSNWDRLSVMSPRLWETLLVSLVMEQESLPTSSLLTELWFCSSDNT